MHCMIDTMKTCVTEYESLSQDKLNVDYRGSATIVSNAYIPTLLQGSLVSIKLYF